MPIAEAVRSSEAKPEEPSEDEAVVVVLLLERPPKTERRLGLLCAWAVDRERTCAACSGGSLEDRVDGGSLLASSSVNGGPPR